MRFPIALDRPGVSHRWKTPGVDGGFGADRGDGTGRKHAAVDIGAPHGTPVLAMADGKVTERGHGDNVFLKAPMPLFAIAIKHDGGFVARYGEINEIPALLMVGARVREGEQIGIVQQHSLHKRAKSMLHLDLYSGSRSGTLSIPGRLKPKLSAPIGKRKTKFPVEFSEEDRRAIAAADTCRISCAATILSTRPIS